MLSIGIFTILIAIPIFSSISTNIWNRITSIILLYSALLSFNGLHFDSIASGVGIYSGLFSINILSMCTEIFILVAASIILYGWAPSTIRNVSFNTIPIVSEYSIFILFTIMGACILICCNDLISMYLSLELQSFAVYILATLYRDSESATSAGLKYFLLGGLSSAFILLGIGLIYSYTGLTQIESIYTILSVSYNEGIIYGLLFIGFGFLFKIAAAPLHNWAPDVYDGVPTIVTMWLATMPKISLLVFILQIMSGIEYFTIFNNLLLISSVISLIIGTVVGLSQYRIKRLLAYSTISHIGFILLALAINTEQSTESFLFYLLQYSITNINIFIILLCIGYMLKIKDIEFIKELSGLYTNNPVLAFSISISLFSIAGIPPMIGFFAKQMVLYSSMHNGYYFISIIAIIVSVISASYYLKIIRVIFFDKPIINTNTINNDNFVTTTQSYIISTFTIITIFFVFQPTILLNSCQLIALSLFYYLIYDYYAIFPICSCSYSYSSFY